MTPSAPTTDAPTDQAREAAQEETLADLRSRIERLETALNVPKNVGRGTMVPLDQAKAILQRNGLQPDEVAPPRPEQRFRDRSTVLVCPTRGVIDSRVIDTWNHMTHVMNQKRYGPIFARGYEVGEAYNEVITMILNHPQLKNWAYVLTVEDDNLPPPDAHIRLLDAIEKYPQYDAISALYCTKDPAQVPMAYGDPVEFKRTGKIYHFPVSKALLNPFSDEPYEVLGIPMGCTLWKMSCFKDVPPPWFMTLSDRALLPDGRLVPHETLSSEQITDAKKCMTQDLYYCERAVRMGKRFAILPSLRIGHLDVNEGVVY